MKAEIIAEAICTVIRGNMGGIVDPIRRRLEMQTLLLTFMQQLRAKQRWMVRHFLAGVLALWVLWLGTVVIFIELRQRSTAAHAEGVLRRIPFWTDYEEER